ncbi:preprotein translocase subunit Tim44 [Sphingomonas lenta]|uniref:Preprotein translocase subunit Tim44 n=2 Tax=Sphingomonas lenta TaxID=1141887 RepID=A0A2A2SL52_9SPHN|nr:preprotein translocase subunit Tim44 [Sphingomonas lenta]
MVAAFLALRLYSVLGKRTGHEQPLPKPAEERSPPLAMPRALDVQPEPRDVGPRPIEAGAEAGLRQIVAAEPGFDVSRFLEGAKAAYRMTLEAFWRGDEAELRELATDDVADAFADAIAARREAGETLDNRLISIERAAVADARVAGREARVSVRFDALIAAVTRDAEGKVVAGSMDDAVETHDVWTFTRTLGAPDPNWKLADTDEA